MARVFVFLLFLLIPLAGYANNEITAISYLLVEKDSFEVIVGKNYHEKLPPASTTKIMTTILALEHLKGAETITPDKNVRRFPRSRLNLIAGKKYLATDLVKGIIVESANDAAYAVGTHIAGSEETFAAMMTARAKDIGAVNTQFRNASGLSAPGHYSTCYDLAIILKYALAREDFMEVASMRYFLFQNGSHAVRYKNHNRFLFCFEPAVVGKTGFTRASRYCYVGAFEKDGKVYILSILGSSNLWGDAVKILRNLYEKVPTDRELRLAKAHAVTIMSEKEKKVRVESSKNKAKKAKKATTRKRQKR